MTVDRRKLIEVSLPLEAINREAAREKSIRHGHPSTLHLWWARRPLAAARAVLFAQLVDDPSAHPDRYPTEEDQQRRREELHALVRKLVKWENSSNADILAEAHKEILDSTGGNPPTILDPFAGGGTIPLEAQRLGLKAVASDLNPVAVLINKALIEIPPKFRNKTPVYPGLAASQIRTWRNAEGLAADVRAYAQWLRDDAEKRIGHLYHRAALDGGATATVIAWIWARTVSCPNPRCRIHMPLVRSWWLGKRSGKEAFVVPNVVDGQVTFTIGNDPKVGPTADTDGTVGRAGAVCVSCRTAVELKYIRGEAQAGRLGKQLMATVADGDRGRIYLAPSADQENAASLPQPQTLPDGDIPPRAPSFRVQAYGFHKYTDLFTPRQLTALCTFSDLIPQARKKILADAATIGVPEGARLADGGTGAAAYADAVATYLGLAISRLTDRNNTICTWDSGPVGSKASTGGSARTASVRNAFARQAIPMTWDYAESNPFSASGGSLISAVDWIVPAIERLQGAVGATVSQRDARAAVAASTVICTDPPYYDNIGYSDLSDFFYVWLRHSLRPVWPDLLATMLVPKAEELVANPYRHNGPDGAKKFFEDGFTTVFARAREYASSEFPITVFYAFKQSESTAEGSASSGWETLLEGMVRSGWTITGTWPMRSELSNRMLARDTNALASSIVLALRPRGGQAPVVDRRGFIAALKSELPARLRELQQGAIAPVDLPQAAIGPGMAVFTRYAKVIESDGSMMSVRSALASINSARDQVLWEMVGDFDATTRFAITWYRQYGYKIGAFGDANNMANGHNTSVAAMERAGILTSRGGNVALISPAALPVDYDPVADMDTNAWEVLHHLIRVLDSDGVAAAGAFLIKIGRRADGGIDPALIKELAFLLFSVADTKKSTNDAISFNNVATSWSDLIDASRSGSEPSPEDFTLDFATDEEEV